MYKFPKSQASKIFNMVFEKPTHKYPTQFSETNFKYKNYCLTSTKHSISVRGPKIWNALSQPSHDVPGTSPEDPLQVLTSGTYRGPSGDSQGTNTKTDDLMKNLFFRSNSPCIYISIPVFYRKNKYSKVLNGDVHGTSAGPSCGTSRGPNDRTF